MIAVARRRARSRSTGATTSRPARCASRSTAAELLRMHDRDRRRRASSSARSTTRTRARSRYPSQTDINLAALARRAVADRRPRRRREPDVRACRIDDGEVDARSTSSRGGRVTAPLVCPALRARARRSSERFCPRLRHAAGVRRRRGVDEPVDRARTSARARSSRSTPRASWCASPARATRPRPSSSRGCCSRRACPSLTRRSRGFDVPDFLAAGPRDVLVPAVGARGRARRAAPADVAARP